QGAAEYASAMNVNNRNSIRRQVRRQTNNRASIRCSPALQLKSFYMWLEQLCERAGPAGHADMTLESILGQLVREVDRYPLRATHFKRVHNLHDPCASHAIPHCAGRVYF